jgi:CelD/BcsL family acetyltransferase involved in cellulose biosynthesis
MQIITLKTLDEIKPWIEGWRKLCRQIPFRQPDWLLPWAQDFMPAGGEPRFVIAVDEESQLRGILPAYVHNKCLRMMGDQVACSDYVNLIVDEDTMDTNIARAISIHLASAPEHHDWSRIEFEAVDIADRVGQLFGRCLVETKMRLRESAPANTWVVDLSRGWEQFVASVSKNSRKVFRRRSEELKKVRVRWVHDESDLIDFFPILIELHQKRRNALGQPGCFADARFETFLRHAAKSLLERQQLMAFSIWLDGKPIAADIGFRSADRWYCYQAGIDPEAMEHEPGKLANIMILRDAERFGIRFVDFLRGDEPYKEQLKANPNPMMNWTFTRPGMKGATGHLISTSKDRVKSFLKRFRKG